MLVIFDLDGPLVKASWRGLFESYKGVVEAGGKDWREYFRNFREFKEWWSPDWRQNDRNLGLATGKEYDRIFYEIYNKYAYLFHWVPAVVSELAKKHSLAIFTNRHRYDANKFIAPIKKHFKFIIGGEDVKNLKPHPEGIYLILQKTGEKKENTLIIGDMPHDLMAGRVAGIKTGVVKWGLGKWKDLLALKPDYKFENYKDLLKI